ncbi:MAG: hypothetical protein ACOY93_17945 [Bacillota bacterium]
MTRLLPRLLLPLLLLLLAACSTGAVTEVKRTPGEKRAETTLTLNGTPVQVTLTVTAEQLAVTAAGGQLFAAPNPLPGFTEVGLEPVDGGESDHLLVKVSDPSLTRGWVLLPGSPVWRTGLEVEADQGVTVTGNLVIVAYRTPREGGGFTVASRIYRYDPGTGRYETSKLPGGAAAAPGAGHAHAPGPADSDASEVSPLSRVERYVYLVVGALLAALCLLLLFRFNQAISQRARTEVELRVQLSKAEAQVLEQQQEIAELKGQLLAARSAGKEGGSPVVALTEGDLAELRAQGLQSPVADLIASLQQRSDLIPLASTLGGRMRFDPPERWTIARRWVIAPFSDGHTGGYLLLRYRVTGGTVEWTALDMLQE